MLPASARLVGLGGAGGLLGRLAPADKRSAELLRDGDRGVGPCAGGNQLVRCAAPGGHLRLGHLWVALLGGGRQQPRHHGQRTGVCAVLGVDVHPLHSHQQLDSFHLTASAQGQGRAGGAQDPGQCTTQRRSS